MSGKVGLLKSDFRKIEFEKFVKMKLLILGGTRDRLIETS